MASPAIIARMPTVSRAVVPVHPRFHPDNGRSVRFALRQGDRSDFLAYRPQTDAMEYLGRVPPWPLDRFIDDIYCLTGVPRHRC